MSVYPVISYADAIETARRTKQYSKWPSRRPGMNRLEPHALPQMRPSFRIPLGCTIFTIGSCFARNIEDFFYRLGFKVPVRDFKIPIGSGNGNHTVNKYTPPAIYYELEWALRVRAGGGFNEATALEKLLRLDDQRYLDVHLAGFVPATSLADAIERRRLIYELYQQAYTADVVTITLGLIEAWWDNEARRYIDHTPSRELANAYPGRFEFRVLDYQDCLDYLCRSIELLNGADRRPNILLTTSPVPLERTFTGDDVLIANCHSKSVLRAVAGEVARRFDNVDYFPSYEMVTLSKSPNVFLDDLIHVNEEFVGSIAVRVYEAYVDVPAHEALEATIAHARAAAAAGDLSPARELFDGGMDRLLGNAHGSLLAFMKAQLLQADGVNAELRQYLSGVNWQDLFSLELVRYGQMQIDAGQPAEAIEALLTATKQGGVLQLATVNAAQMLVDHCLDSAPDRAALARQVCAELVALPIMLKDSRKFWLTLARGQLAAGEPGLAWKAARTAAMYKPEEPELVAYVQKLEADLLSGGIELELVHAREECWHQNLAPAQLLIRKYVHTPIPQSSQLSFNYLHARVLSENGENDRLRDVLERISADDLDGLERLFLGKMHAEAGNLDIGEAILRDCLSRGVAVFIAGQLLISHCLSVTPDKAGLVQQIRSAIENARDQDTAGYWFTLALLQSNTGEEAAARESARLAAELEPTHSWYVGLAEMLSGSSA